MQLSEQEIRRREEKTELENLGINPYPPELFEVNVTSKDILTNYEKQKTDYKIFLSPGA
jgi:lysyl-tRNA synthetase class 2